MSDHTRSNGDDAPGPDPDRTPSSDGAGAALPADLGHQIDDLRTEGELVLALAVPWSESVRTVLAHYEQTVAPLHLDDELHHQVGEAAGITQLYELLDTLTIAASDVF